MLDNKVPIIKPIKLQEFDTKQSKYDMAPRVPFRSLVLAPSGGGKTVLIQNMILDIYRDCFSRIYIFSPSIDVDSTWLLVKKYIEKRRCVLSIQRKSLFILTITTPKLFTRYYTHNAYALNITRKKDFKKLLQILIIIDDSADDPSFTR